MLVLKLLGFSTVGAKNVWAFSNDLFLVWWTQNDLVLLWLVKLDFSVVDKKNRFYHGRKNDFILVWSF